MPKKHEEALQDWLSGMSRIEIAQKYCVRIETVRAWYGRYHWKQEREKIKDKLQESFYAKLTDKVTQAVDNYVAGSLLVSKMGLAVIQEIYQQVPQNYAENWQQIQRWIKIMESAANVHKAVIPEIPEAMAQQMLEELKKIRNNDDND